MKYHYIKKQTDVVMGSKAGNSIIFLPDTTELKHSSTSKAVALFEVLRHINSISVI